jgi:hypothetical protein
MHLDQIPGWSVTMAIRLPAIRYPRAGHLTGSAACPGAANEPVTAFDCNANGWIDFADVVRLFNHQ